MGNAASMLLILRATDLLQTGGRAATRRCQSENRIVLYAAHNGAASLAAIGGGHLADRFTAREVFMGGAVAYVIGYTVFAVGGSGWPVLLAAFVVCGVGIGFAETAESTVIAKGLSDRLRSKGFGVLGLTQAFGDLGAILVAAMLWSLRPHRRVHLRHGVDGVFGHRVWSAHRPTCRVDRRMTAGEPATWSAARR